MSKHTAAWRFQVWASFVIATVVTGLGIAYLPVVLWTKAFLAMGLLFTVGSSFSLAKTIRDDHEMNHADARREERGHPFRAA